MNVQIGMPDTDQKPVSSQRDAEKLFRKSEVRSPDRSQAEAGNICKRSFYLSGYTC